MVRGVRGAITVEENTSEAIKEGTKLLLNQVVTENHIQTEDIVSAIFTVTDDLDADFPASAAREIGWDQVPLICAKEIAVPGSMRLCIRVLLHLNTETPQADIRHIYLRKAVSLRKDLAAQ